MIWWICSNWEYLKDKTLGQKNASPTTPTAAANKKATKNETTEGNEQPASDSDASKISGLGEKEPPSSDNSNKPITKPTDQTTSEDSAGISSKRTEQTMPRSSNTGKDMGKEASTPSSSVPSSKVTDTALKSSGSQEATPFAFKGKTPIRSRLLPKVGTERQRQSDKDAV